MWTRMVAIALLEVVQEELCQHVLLGALLFVLRPSARGSVAAGAGGTAAPGAGTQDEKKGAEQDMLAQFLLDNLQ